MKTFASILIAGALFAGLVTVTSADPVPAGCDKQQSVITCGPVVENVGNAPGHSSAQETETTTTQKASFESSHDPSTVCEGPPGQCR
jgi:hypothetical protein